MANYTLGIGWQNEATRIVILRAGQQRLSWHRSRRKHRDAECVGTLTEVVSLVVRLKGKWLSLMRRFRELGEFGCL